MSILSTLNKLTGKHDKSVLAALNSLTGKTADDIEEAIGNLTPGGGGDGGESAATTLVSFVHDPELDDIEEELTESQIDSLMSGICLYWGEDKSLSDPPCISLGGIEPYGAHLELPRGINVYCIFRPTAAGYGSPEGMFATVWDGTSTPDTAFPLLSTPQVSSGNGWSVFTTMGETMTLNIGISKDEGRV